MRCYHEIGENDSFSGERRMRDEDKSRDELLEELKSLKAEKELLDKALDSMVDTFFIFDPHKGKALKWNKAFRDISGFTDEEIAQKTVPDDWYGEHDLRKAYLALEQNYEAGWAAVEMELLPREGPGIPFEYTSSVSRDDEGKPEYIVVLGRDVTERNLVEDYLSWQLKVTAALARLYRPTISARASMQKVAGNILEEAMKLTGSKNGFVSSLDPETHDNVIHTGRRNLTNRMEAHLREDKEHHRLIFPIGKDDKYTGLLGHVLNTRQPFYTNEAGSHPGEEEMMGTHSEYESYHGPIERFLSIPVMVGDELLGQIAVANPRRDYNERDLEAVQRLASFYALAIQRMRA